MTFGLQEDAYIAINVRNSQEVISRAAIFALAAKRIGKISAKVNALELPTFGALFGVAVEFSWRRSVFSRQAPKMRRSALNRFTVADDIRGRRSHFR